MPLESRTREQGVYNIWKTRETCAIEIYSPGAETYVAGHYVPGVPTIHWSGPARVQVVRSGEREYLPGADMTAQLYQFQIDPNASVVPTDAMLVHVTDGGNMPDLEAYTLYITTAFNSGESFEKTFYATVNSGR